MHSVLAYSISLWSYVYGSMSMVLCLWFYIFSSMSMVVYGVAPKLVLCHAGISAAGGHDMRQELSSLAPVIVSHRSRRTALTHASGAYQAL